MNTTTQEPTKQIQFNANPWSLAFNSLSQVFKINQNPAITIIVGSIIIWIANQVLSNIPDVLNAVVSDADEGTRMGVQMFGIIFSLGFFAVSIFVSTLWAGFTAFVGVKNARGERVAVGESLKAGLSKFWSVFAVNFMIGLFGLLCLLPAIAIVIAGVVLIAADQDGVAAGLFIASGIAAVVGLFFAIRISFQRALSLYSVFDENSGVFESMSRSVVLTKGRLIEIWGVSFTSIIPFVGELLKVCGLGSHYLQLKVYRDHNVEMPKVHILSWLPAILLGVSALFVMLLAGLFALIAAAN
jgi:hypothetical protein